MTNQMLDVREEIARKLYWVGAAAKYGVGFPEWETLTPKQQDYLYKQADSLILSIKLGSHTLKEIIELWQCYTERLELITKLTQLYDEGKLVKESEDQSLPEGVGRCMDCTDSYKMQEAGFKKVEPL